MHQTQEHARNSGNTFYFDQDTLYSYMVSSSGPTLRSRFPIACWSENERRQRAVLFTTGSDSQTTTQRKNLVKRAIPIDVDVFNVPHVDAQQTGIMSHMANVHAYREKITALAGKASRSRRHTHRTGSEALNTQTEATRYVEFFGLDTDPFEIPDLEKLRARATHYWEKERDRESQRQEQIDRENRRAIEKWENGGREEWRNGAAVGVPWFVDHTYLRIVSNTGSTPYIETSHGAKVPLDRAVKVLPLILGNRTGRTEALPKERAHDTPRALHT